VGAVRAEAFAVGLALFGVAIALVLGGSLWLFYLAGVAAATVFNRTVGVQPASELSLRRDAVGWGLFAISFYALLWAGVLLVVHSQS
jgi:hypothetical protein